jgi:hypothetical protein
MSDMKKLVTLLNQWQTHETEHASLYCSWAKKAHAEGLVLAGDALERAAIASERSRECFVEALESLTEAKTDNKSSLKMPDVPLEGSADIACRLRVLNKTQQSAVLTTVSDQMPYSSLVRFAMLDDLSGVLFLTPKVSAKYHNLVKSPHVALLMDNRTQSGDDLLETEAITMLGIARLLHKGNKYDQLMHIFLKKHPDLKSFAEAKTTALIAVEAEKYIHVSQFQVVTIWKLQKP